MSEILQYIFMGLGAIAVISYGYSQIRRGSNESKSDTIGILDREVKILKGEVERLTKEVHSLRTEIEIKDKKLGEALSILQGRDPQMQEFIKQMKEYTELGKKVMETVSVDIFPVISKLDKFLNKQTF